MSHLALTFRKVPWTLWALAGILVIGIFVRTYHFHDWLRFNADQSRDAGIVSSVVEGETSLPLLGPKAGGTDFRLGSAFYMFQIVSAKIFGDRPDVMAYPDLLSSILAIPLLYCFLRLYFERKTSLLLTTVFAVSFYAVKYSRFAWNPNSLPFWTLLFFYALHRLVLFAGKAEKKWAVLLGIALGIGMQLHTLTLIMLPIATVTAFGYLALYRRKGIGKLFLIVSAMALLLNVGQIASEFQTGGENVSAFFSGVGKKQEKGNGLVRNITKDTVCFVQSSVYILTSHDSSDTCDTKSIGTEKNGAFFLGGLILFVGGILLAIRAFRREEDSSRRYFLVINLLFLLLSFLLLIPLANEISMRFFLMIVFIPFVMLGLWFEFLSEKFPRYAFSVAALLSSALVLSNMYAVRQSFVEYASYLDEHSMAGMDNVLLREVEEAADFIAHNAGSSKTVSLGGDSKYLFKALKSIRYYTERQGIDIVQQGKKDSENFPVFLVDNTKQNEKTLKKYPAVIDWKIIGRFTIFRLP
ncbi:MAG: glycosyltransferase family 39 protein [Candidatus Moraniibacteriota bacterium]